MNINIFIQIHILRLGCLWYNLIRRRCDRQECERAIAAWRSPWDFVQRKANKPKSLYSSQKKKTTTTTVLELLKRHWGVSIVVYSIIWTNPFDDLSSYANREWNNVVSTGSTGFRTNKRYAYLLEFLGDLCPASFCLSMIPFISAINVILYRKCCAGINKFLEYSGKERQSVTSTAFKLLSLRSEHVQLWA